MRKSGGAVADRAWVGRGRAQGRRFSSMYVRCGYLFLGLLFSRGVFVVVFSMRALFPRWAAFSGGAFH